MLIYTILGFFFFLWISIEIIDTQQTAQFTSDPMESLQKIKSVEFVRWFSALLYQSHYWIFQSDSYKFREICDSNTFSAMNCFNRTKKLTIPKLNTFSNTLKGQKITNSKSNYLLKPIFSVYLQKKNIWPKCASNVDDKSWTLLVSVTFAFMMTKLFKSQLWFEAIGVWCAVFICSGQCWPNHPTPLFCCCVVCCMLHYSFRWCVCAV